MFLDYLFKKGTDLLIIDRSGLAFALCQFVAQSGHPGLFEYTSLCILIDNPLLGGIRIIEAWVDLGTVLVNLLMKI